MKDFLQKTIHSYLTKIVAKAVLKVCICVDVTACVGKSWVVPAADCLSREKRNICIATLVLGEGIDRFVS